MAELKKDKSRKNLKDINSFYVVKEIFSFLNENQKLSMIIYNKQLQKKFLVDIKDYQNINRRYKIVDKNGKGKEYILNTNTIIFRGEYINGKRNGEGKEYYENGKLEFEGEYINGKRSGKGQEYYENGNCRFKGEYINGLKFKGKEFHDNGRSRFEGEYLKEKKWNGKGYNEKGNLEYKINNGTGKIKEYYDNGILEFEGEYLNEKKKWKRYRILPKWKN